MIEFSSLNPFPHYEAGSYSYLEAKEHATAVDQWLGFEIAGIEERLVSRSGQEIWQHLDAQAFQTPYLEIRTLLESLQLPSASKVIDLGCGYGRMAHVIGRHFPDLQFLGYEIVRERVSEGLRVLAGFSYLNVQLSALDLTESSPESADCYFLYDYGTVPAIEKTLQDLREISRSRPIQVVARGRASRFLIHKDNAWLSEVNPPRHFETFSIYQS